MKIILLTIMIAIGNLGFSQAIDYNQKKGVALGGYDVTSYFNGEALKGTKNFTALHDNVTYKFANEANKETFVANPTKYLPQYGGYCAYAVGLKGEKIGVNPETYLIKDDKLYLFYNSFGVNTLKKWNNEDPKKLQEAADSNWNALKLTRE